MTSVEPTVGVESYTSSVLLFSTVSLTTYFLIKTLTRSKRNGLPLPPSLPSLPVLGSFPFMSGSNSLPQFFRKTSHRLGPVFGVTIESEYAVVLNTAEVIQEALIKKARAFSGRFPGYTAVHYLNPNRYGIVGKQYGSEFRRCHQVTLSILKEFGFGSRIIQERILEEVEEIVEIVSETNGKAFNPGNIFSRCTINVIASIVFGERMSQRDALLDMLASNFRDFIQGKRRHIDHCPALRFLPHYRTSLRESVDNQEELMVFIDKYTSRSLESERQSFVRRYIEVHEGSKCNREDLNFLVRDLLIAGSETTSATVQFAMIRMANHPEVQRRVQMELDSVASRGSLVTLDDMPRLPYVEAAILEVMRLHPAVPLAIPHCTLADTELAGFFIPRGTTIYPNILGAHMDQKVWTDPERFYPERFLDSDGEVVGKELIMTFSVGKRSCLGELLARQEVFLIITNLLRNFNILPPEGQDGVCVTENYLITLFPSPYDIRLVSRL